MTLWPFNYEKLNFGIDDTYFHSFNSKKFSKNVFKKTGQNSILMFKST